MKKVSFCDDKITFTVYNTDVSDREFSLLVKEIEKNILSRFFYITYSVIYVQGGHRYFFVIHKLLSRIRWNL